jgi:hypothetical protein
MVVVYFSSERAIVTTSTTLVLCRGEWPISNASSAHPQRPRRQYRSYHTPDTQFRTYQGPLVTGGRRLGTHQPSAAEPNDITNQVPFIPVSPIGSFFPGSDGMLDAICETCGISINYCMHALVGRLAK